MIHTKSGKRLTTHAECYEAGYNDAMDICWKEEIPKYRDMGFNKGWKEAARIYGKEIEELKAKLDKYEQDEKEYLEGLDKWASGECGVI